MDTLLTLASIPAILALVNLLKNFGLSGKWSALVAVLLGVALNVAEGQFATLPVYQQAASGLILGLSAAGLFDLAKTAGTIAYEPKNAV